jgi:polysaccharide deacetylase 2 family uncharacterized protein YibQ
LARSSSKSRRKGGARRKSKRGIPLSAVVLIVLFAAATASILYLTKHENARGWLKEKVTGDEPPDPALLALRVQQGAMSALTSLGISVEQVSEERGDADGSSSGPALWRATLPAGVSLERANVTVTKAVERASGRILDGLEWRAKRSRVRRLTLVAAADSTPCLELRLTEGAETAAVTPRAKLAIVVVEMGRKLDSTARGLIESAFPLTVAILPACPASGETAELACAKGKEILLDLPMEPAGYPRVDPGEGALLLDQSAREVRNRLRDHLKDLECCSGVANYMGSAFMRDRDLVEAVLEEIGSDRLYFLDISEGARPAVVGQADALGVPCLGDDLSIEPGGGAERLARGMDRAEELALRRGRALVVTRPTPYLLELLASRADGYDSKGIALVSASDLLEDG